MRILSILSLSTVDYSSNIANDNSSINANQYSNIDYEHLEDLISKLIETIDKSSNSTNIDFINDNIEIIREETKKPNPEKKIIKNSYQWHQISS